MTGTGLYGASVRLTRAQQSNLLPLTAWGYQVWRFRSLGLLSMQPFNLSREAALFLSLCRPEVGERWLDAGTSTGFYARVLADQGAQVDAADLSAPMLDVARRQLPGRDISWLLLNVEHSGLPGGEYDGVTVGATLNETADPARFLRECQRLLRPGGKLWLMYLRRTGGPLQRLLGPPGGLTFPDIAWIERQVPELRLRHLAQFGAIDFALLVKEPV